MLRKANERWAREPYGIRFFDTTVEALTKPQYILLQLQPLAIAPESAILSVRRGEHSFSRYMAVDNVTPLLELEPGHIDPTPSRFLAPFNQQEHLDAYPKVHPLLLMINAEVKLYEYYERNNGHAPPAVDSDYITLFHATMKEVWFRPDGKSWSNAVRNHSDMSALTPSRPVTRSHTSRGEIGKGASQAMESGSVAERKTERRPSGSRAHQEQEEDYGSDDSDSESSSEEGDIELPVGDFVDGEYQFRGMQRIPDLSQEEVKIFMERASNSDSAKERSMAFAGLISRTYRPDLEALRRSQQQAQAATQ